MSSNVCVPNHLLGCIDLPTSLGEMEKVFGENANSYLFWIHNVTYGEASSAYLYYAYIY